MLILQLSAGHGPEECQVAVKHALRALCGEAEGLDVRVYVVEECLSKHGLHSALVSLDGAQAQTLVHRWVGTIQWNCASPLRPKYPRKNWFIGVQQLAQLTELLTDEQIVFSTCKSSGKGGQHVNKTESAVHARHVATGIAVKVQTERSQHANKKLARELIAVKLAERGKRDAATRKRVANAQHWAVERGNPVRVFQGERFEACDAMR